MKKNRKIEMLNEAAAKARKESISNGTWRPRPAVHKSKKDYDRNAAKKEMRDMKDE